jgi:hypothetical protein
MAIEYASGTKINNLTVCNDKADLCAAFDSALTGAGWTVANHTSSTDNTYQSGLTPQNNQIRVRIWDSGGNCVRIRMMNVAQTIAQVDSCFLYVTTSTSYRIIANQFQFVALVPGSLSSRNFVIGSALYLPPNLVEMGLTTCAVLLGNGNSDTDASNLTGSWRSSLTSRGFANANPSNGWTLLNATPVEYDGLTYDTYPHPGLPAFATVQSAAIDFVSGYRWHDDSALIMEPLVCWGAPTLDSEGKIRGQLWDAFLATDSYAADITTVVDSHNYYNLTNSNNGNYTSPASMRGSLFVVVP